MTGGRPSGTFAALALAGEALVLLAVARLMVATLPLRRIGPIMARRGSYPDATAEMIDRINWALSAAGRRLPMRTACYERGIAACWMLARRGSNSLMHYGVGRRDCQIAAHVWVTSGMRGVVGADNADDFKELARF